MPKEPHPFQRYVDLGMALTEEARRRAEEIFRELAREGEAGRTQATEWVGEVVDKSRKSSEQFVDLVRDEVRRQLQSLDLTNRDDVIHLVQRVADTLGETRDKLVELLGEAGEKVSGVTRVAHDAGEKVARGRKGKRRKEDKEEGHEIEAAHEAPTPGASFAKKAAARKAAAQQAPAKAAATNSAPATKSAAPARKAAPAKKAAGTAAPAGKATGGRAATAKKTAPATHSGPPAADE